MTRLFAIPHRYDLGRSLSVLGLGRSDPTARVSGREAWWTTLTPVGAATLLLRRVDDARLSASAYGPGADWVLDRAEEIAGLRDDVAGFGDLARAHPLVYRLSREHSGLRMPATGRVFQALLPTIIGQKVTGVEAKRSMRSIVCRFGERAPGPVDDLYAPPDPRRLAETPYYELHRHGLEQKRADTIRRAAAEADRLDTAPDSTTATRWLTAIAGIGPWSAAEVTRVAYGDPDQVSVGDYHIPNQVAWALAGEPRGTDERMLELLAPFAGHRGRVCLLLAAAGIGAPRFGPRMPVRSFAKF